MRNFYFSRDVGVDPKERSKYRGGKLCHVEEEFQLNDLLLVQLLEKEV